MSSVSDDNVYKLQTKQFDVLRQPILQSYTRVFSLKWLKLLLATRVTIKQLFWQDIQQQGKASANCLPLSYLSHYLY